LDRDVEVEGVGQHRMIFSVSIPSDHSRDSFPRTSMQSSCTHFRDHEWLPNWEQHVGDKHVCLVRDAHGLLPETNHLPRRQAGRRCRTGLDICSQDGRRISQWPLAPQTPGMPPLELPRAQSQDMRDEIPNRFGPTQSSPASAMVMDVPQRPSCVSQGSPVDSSWSCCVSLATDAMMGSNLPSD
jgi:hypothetical protein